MYRYGKERKHKCTKKNVILDPRTKKCLKLSIKGKNFDKYVIPYIIGQRSFLDSYSNAIVASSYVSFVTITSYQNRTITREKRDIFR